MLEALKLIDDVSLNITGASSLALNISIAFIMFGVALELDLREFVKLFKSPKPVFVGIFSQFLLIGDTPRLKERWQQRFPECLVPRLLRIFAINPPRETTQLLWVPLHVEEYDRSDERFDELCCQDQLHVQLIR